MTTIEQHLRDGDPFATESPMSATDIERMRNAVLAAAEDAPAVRVPWFALAATALAVVAGTFVTRTEPTPVGRAEPLVLGGIGGAAPRQLQFATPGGTRVIWMFNPELELR